MSEHTWWETIKAEGQELLNKLEGLIREGNVRRVVIKQGDRVIAEFPLMVGVVGAVVAPVLAAIGAIVALAKDCKIEVEARESLSARAVSTLTLPCRCDRLHKNLDLRLIQQTRDLLSGLRLKRSGFRLVGFALASMIISVRRRLSRAKSSSVCLFCSTVSGTPAVSRLRSRRTRL
jgi:hypothetical protein